VYEVRGLRIESDEGGGHVTHYKYDDRGYLERVTFPGGASQVFVNSVRGEIMDVTGGGVPVHFIRNSRGLVAEKRLGGDASKVVTSFKYDLNDNVTETTLNVEDVFGPEAARFGVYEIASGKRVVRFEYDLLNRKVKEIHRADGKELVQTFKYSPQGNLEKVQAPPLNAFDDFVTDYVHDARGLEVERTEAAGTKDARVTKTRYDNNGNIERIERSSGGIGAATTMVHDGQDRLVSTTDVLGSDHTIRYDLLGNIVHAETKGIDGTGDGAKRLLYRADFSFDAYGHMVTKRIDTLSGAIAETQWWYDGSLRLVKQRDPNRATTAFSYTLSGHVEDVTDPAGNVTHHVYDTAGKAARVEETDVEQAFDAATGAYSPRKVKYTTVNTYDEFERLVQVTSPTSTVRMYYDTAGQLRATVSSAEGRTLQRYDGFGRRIEVSRLGRTVKTEYTPGGRTRSTQALVDLGGAILGHEEFAYDVLGNLTSRKNLTSGAETVIVRDGLGRGKRTIDPNSTVVERTFNAAGQPLTTKVDAPTAMAPRLGTRIEDKVRPAVAGVQSESFRYDGLGRLVRAANEQFYGTRFSDVRLKYDGLGRATEETQSFWGLTQTVRHAYAEDGKWTDVIYPELAGNVRVRTEYDAMGRATEVAVGGVPAATYLYSGTDRIARERLGNGAQRRFAYDDRKRLVRLELASPGASEAGHLQWSQDVAYEEGRPVRMREVQHPLDNSPFRVLTTTIRYDSLLRPVEVGTVRATAINAAGDRSIGVERTVQLSEYAAGQLERVAEFTRADAGEVSIARVDAFAYAKNGAIGSLASRGRLGGKMDAIATEIDAVAKHVSGDEIASDQSFAYDFKGNLLADGRFVYTYDYADRIVRIEDTYSPFRYTETVDFFYDALGRRIMVSPGRTQPHSVLSWGGEWSKSPQQFVYDGHRVIAEIARPQSAAPSGKVPPPTLLARYVFGAQDTSRIRMDRRPENELDAPLQTYYLHGDLRGSLHAVSGGTNGIAAFVANREPPPGTDDAAPGRPPGDEYMVTGTRIRVPYVGDMSRVDGFAGTLYREDLVATPYEYRSAYAFARKLDEKHLRSSLSAEHNRMFGYALVGVTALTGIAALPEVAGMTVASLTWANLGQAALVTGGTISFKLVKARATGGDYSASDLAEDLVGGAVDGVTGGMTQILSIGRVANFAASRGRSLAWDAATGRASVDAFAIDSVVAAGMEILGAAAGRVQTSGLNAYGRRQAAHIERTSQSVRNLGNRAELPEVAARTSGRPSIDAGRPMRDRSFWAIPRDYAERLFDDLVMHELMNGTAHSREIGRMIRSGELWVSFRDFGHDRAYARYHLDSGISTVNTHELRRASNGQWRTRQVASSIVHEGLHHLGFGEIGAHVGQAQFLVDRISKVRSHSLADRIQRGHVPELDDAHFDLISRYQRVGDSRVAQGMFVHELRGREYDFREGNGVRLMTRDPHTGNLTTFRMLDFALQHPLPSTGSNLLDAMIRP
jgi:YD repeat-containing protein